MTVREKILDGTAIGPSNRPVMLAIAGDSGSGKTTLARGLVEGVGAERCTWICLDDYHRYDRTERSGLPCTAIHPDCNFPDIVEQHLQLLALGRPILKPVYDHTSGTFGRSEYVSPREFVIVEGLHPIASKLMRSCFDMSVYLDPPEELRRAWKVRRDCADRGYAADEVLAELARREPESEQFVRPQRTEADIVVRFAPSPNEPDEHLLSATLLLRPTLPHLRVTHVLPYDLRSPVHVKIVRDLDGTPMDCIQVQGHASADEARRLRTTMWADLGDSSAPAPSGLVHGGRRSATLALTQSILLYHLLLSQEHRSG